MSFVIGLATGYETNKLVEERAIRRHVRDYFKRRGIRLIDRSGRRVSAEEFLNQIMPQRSRWKAIVLGGIVVAGVVVLAVVWSSLVL